MPCLALGMRQNPSKRRNMEDVHRIVPNLGEDPNVAYFAVYDGHGGMRFAAAIRLHSGEITRLYALARKDEASWSSLRRPWRTTSSRS